MCGIAGYIGRARIQESNIEKTLGVMKNRGPDKQSFQRIEDGSLHVELLHSRLTILDFDPRSDQPFRMEHISMVYNGEVYNYLELRKDLEKEGIVFRTTSDTEVVARYYLKYGKKCVEYFEGMWSFAIYDHKSHELFLSRDRFAEKPLYYLESDDGIYFGSEIKFLKALSGRALSLNYDYIIRYLKYGYKSLYKDEQGYFREISELPPASNAVLNLSRLKVEPISYWKPLFQPKVMTLQDAIEGAREKFLDSMRIRLRSDVPLAFCLSGGVDSNSIVSVASKVFNLNVNTYSIIDKDQRYDESENINATVRDLGCKNHSIVLEQQSSLKSLRDLIRYHDAPIATITYFIHSFLLREISKEGGRVVFSGTSADELFSGYYDHFNFYLYEMRNHPQFEQFLEDWKANIGKVVRNPFLKDPKLFFKNPNFRGHVYLNSEEFSQYLSRDIQLDFKEEAYCSDVMRNRMMNEIFREATRVILHEDDLNSMYYSVENRSPFLDRRLFDFCNTIPTEYLIQNGYGKYILRQAMKGIVNDKVRLDVQKKGFNASIHSLFDFQAKEIRQELLEDSPVFEIFNREKLESLLREPHLENSFSKFLFNFINIKLFLEEFA